MTHRTWLIASALSIAAVLAFLGWGYWEKCTELDLARASLAEARTALETNTALAAVLGEENAHRQARIEELQKEKEAVARMQKNLEDEMRSALVSKDITISQLQGKLTVNILDRILFDSGEADLKSEGEAVLQKIAAILAQYPKRQVHVIGHTDNVPIRASARNRYPSNWELSTARAMAAVRFLSEKAGVDPRRLGAVGYGEFQPLADNALPEGRAKNRRIALVVLPEELKVVEVPKVVSAQSTNAIEPSPAVTTTEPEIK